jgi:exoribonuclease-2
MTTSPLPHEGLGVPQYAWMTSPLRRYCDLVNQWQLIACLKGETPAFAQKSAELFGAMRDFELTYAAYADFQRQMERYWCLRWLQQHGIERDRRHRAPRATGQARPSAHAVARAIAARRSGARPAPPPGRREYRSTCSAPEISCRFLSVLDEVCPKKADELEAEEEGRRTVNVAIASAAARRRSG